jgi:hypothetical protein
MEFLQTSHNSKTIFLEVPAERPQPEGYRGCWPSDLPSHKLAWSSSKKLPSGMAWNLVLLREPCAQPPLLCRPTPRVPRNLEWRVDSPWSPSSGCLDQQGQPSEMERSDWCVRGCPQVSPPSPTIEEIGSPGMGIQRSSRPNSGISRKDNSRATGKAFGRNVSRHLQLALRQSGAPLPHQNGKGFGKAPGVI